MATKKNEGGRGKKQCPKCQAYLGARQAKCECGHEFPVKARTARGRQLDPMALISRVKELGGVTAIQKTLTEIAALETKIAEKNEALKTLGGVVGAEKALETLAEVKEALK